MTVDAHLRRDEPWAAAGANVAWAQTEVNATTLEHFSEEEESKTDATAGPTLSLRQTRCDAATRHVQSTCGSLVVGIDADTALPSYYRVDGADALYDVGFGFDPARATSPSSMKRKPTARAARTPASKEGTKEGTTHESTRGSRS